MKNKNIIDLSERRFKDNSNKNSVEITICINCSNFINLEPNSSREDMWYNHLCKANSLPTKIDFFDGKEKPYGINDLGKEYFSEHPYKYCRDCNDGHCAKFSLSHP